MATQDTKKPGTQPAEDMFGRPTSPRHEEPAARPAKDAPGKAAPSEEKRSTRQSTEEEDDEPRRDGIDEMGDGDGPRSDRGNNPLPESYWADYPGEKP
jgi:hypothetical protein